MSKMLLTLLTVALPLLGIYLYNKVYYKRYTQFKDFPQLPTSLAFGHLALLDKFIKQGPLDRHPDYVFNSMRNAIGKPPVAFFDLRPFNRPVVLISSHEAAEQVSKATPQFPTSVPKADVRYLKYVIGDGSMLLAEGDEWKKLRKRFNPGFTMQHLFTLLPSMIDKTSIFVRHLERCAETGEEVNLVSYLVDLTFDIIGAAVMDFDFHAQDRAEDKGEIFQLFLELLSCYRNDKIDSAWWIAPHVEWKRYRLGKRIHRLIEEVVCDKHLEDTQNHRRGEDIRPSIISLSLKDTPELTPELLSSACDQIKTFLLAGHDTVSTALAWALYELHRTPHALKSVREELNRVLGPDADPVVVSETLRDPTHAEKVMNKLPYLSAVIKENLRLHPPAATARTAPPGSSFAIKTHKGQSLITDGAIMYSCISNIHRDPAVYGDAHNSFIPERWLSSEEAGGGIGPAEIPAGAWRPFERGPRNCIGQQFAMMEMRFILVIVARRFDFTKVGLGALALDEHQRPILCEDGQYKVESELYGARQINVQPVDGMAVKVKLAAAGGH